MHNLRHNKVLHQRVIILVQTTHTPHVTPDERLSVAPLGCDLFNVVLRYGFMDEPNVPEALALAREQGLEIDFADVTPLPRPRDRDRDEEPRDGDVAGEAVRADGQERDSRHRVLQAAARQRRRARRAGRNLSVDVTRFDIRGTRRVTFWLAKIPRSCGTRGTRVTGAYWPVAKGHSESEPVS